MALINDAANDVPLRDVRRFVCEHTGQFILVARRQDQAAVDRDEPPGTAAALISGSRITK